MQVEERRGKGLSVGDAGGEERGSLVVGEVEARFCRIEGGGEGRVVFAEVLRGEKEVFEIGLNEPVVNRRPETLGLERGNELQL